MSVMRIVNSRLPEKLARAVDQRAAALGVSASDVMREGAVRAVSAPLDRRSRAYVELWLDGQETNEPSTEEV